MLTFTQQQAFGGKFLDGEPCANLAKRLQDESDAVVFSPDAASAITEEYARQAEMLLHPAASPAALEFAYSRLFGTRGNLCRICPTSITERLPKKTVQRWAWADQALREAFQSPETLFDLAEAAQTVEEGWAAGMERFISAMSANAVENDAASRLGILKAIDTVGMHLAQRELFQLSNSLSLRLENAQSVKLRVRLISLFLTLHRCGFCSAFPAIQSYRRTFRIFDPLAYPWWFVDCRLTEKQLNWTFKRLPLEELDWRF